MLIALFPITLNAIKIANVPLCMPISIPIAIACAFTSLNKRGMKYPIPILSILSNKAGKPTTLKSYPICDFSFNIVSIITKARKDADAIFTGLLNFSATALAFDRINIPIETGPKTTKQTSSTFLN